MKKALLALAGLCLSSAALADYQVIVANTSTNHSMDISFVRCAAASVPYNCGPVENMKLTSYQTGGQYHVHTDAITNIHDDQVIQITSVTEKNEQGKVIAKGQVNSDRFGKVCDADAYDAGIVLDDMLESPYIRCDGKILKTAEQH